MEVSTIPPFPLGSVLKGTAADGTTLINDHLLGTECWHPAKNTSTPIRGNKGRLVGAPIRAIAVRNTSGVTLYGKRVGRCERTAGYDLLKEVDGYASTLSLAHVGIIDSYLPSSGVAANDIFWLIVEGPCTVLTPAAGAGFSGDIAVGNWLVSATAASSQTTTAGRVSNVTLPGQTGDTSTFNAVMNVLGRALSARTTGETEAELLIEARVMGR